MLPLPRSSADLTADWLSHALRPSFGALTLRDVTLTRIGQAQGFSGGALYRVALHGVGGASGVPASVVAKFSPAHPALSRRLWSANRREVAFYAGPGRAGLPVPKCHFAQAESEDEASLLLLEDLGAARLVPFAVGLDGAEAVQVVDALAALHARHWEADSLSDLDGNAILDEFDFAGCWARYPAAIARLMPDITLPPAFLALGDRLAAGGLRDLVLAGPHTLVHRDVQADNLAFRAGQGAVLFDWQMMGRGPGVWDLAYLMAGSLSPATRRAVENELVARYHAGLIRGGVARYGLDACRADYRQGVAGKLFFTVVATLLFDNATPEKQAWRRTDLHRLLAFAADHAIPATGAAQTGILRRSGP